MRCLSQKPKQYGYRHSCLQLVLKRQQESRRIRGLSPDLSWTTAVPFTSWVPLGSVECLPNQAECVARLLYHPYYSGTGHFNTSLTTQKGTVDSSSNRPSFSVSVEL